MRAGGASAAEPGAGGGPGTVLDAAGLGKRFGRRWALRDCSLRVPAGRVTALVGPNGAGKTTLLHLAAGLTQATEGSVTVLGGLAPGSPAALPGVGFVAQDAPLYPNLTVAGMLALAACLNSGWDAGAAGQVHALVRAGEREPVPAGFEASRPGLPELVLGYLREPAASALPGPAVLAGAGLSGAGPDTGAGGDAR